ncbi:MAG: 30S ribosome-binding factor RbfA [Firmicutes bacterium]|nr:30S ribosome-binding factor RbfA [Bacillota bacterium]
MSNRVTRLQEAIKREASYIIQQKVKDPRLGFVSITDVELSNDLSYCKIFVSVLGDENQREQTMIGLNKATGFIRSEIGKSVKLRHVPEIVFQYDNSIEHGSRIEAILREITGAGGGEDGDDGE